MKSQFDEVMERKMDRLEFLRLFMLAAIGVTGLLRLLDTVSHSARQTGGGYGEGAYGGPSEAVNGPALARQGVTPVRSQGPPPLVHL